MNIKTFSRGTCFLPGWAKDLSAPMHKLATEFTRQAHYFWYYVTAYREVEH